MARTAEQAIALLAVELDRHRGRTPVFPATCDWPAVARAAYGWGGRNCEVRFGQVGRDCPAIRGVSWPTFLPETA
jgi:hypothetical protein